MSKRLPLVAIGTALIVVCGVSCSPPPSEERASLCEDLDHLAATVGLIVSPPADASVGDVRGAVEKLDPTIRQAEEAHVVSDADADALRAEHEAALEALEGTGDDTPFAEVPAERLEPLDALVVGYRGLVATLGCAGPDAGSG